MAKLLSCPSVTAAVQNRTLRVAAGAPSKTQRSCKIFVVNRRLKVCLAAVLAVLQSVPAWAEPVSQLKATGYVNDFAHVLDPSAVSQMSDICRQVDEKAHAQIAVVTINTIDGADIESYAVDLFHQWGIGSKSTNRGVLILYVIRDRRARIEVGYGLEPILPDGKVGSFQREASPLMRSGDYSQALLLVTGRVADVIASDAGVQLTGARARAPAGPVNQHPGGPSLGGILIIIVILLIVLVTPLRSLLFWILFSSTFGGGGGYRGGGFGGFGGGGGFGGAGWGGGGGGFGGFGGGSSGGGGASSSW
jgi:uncharacterized protein